MSCKDCKWYCKERRVCVKTGYFQFENIPIYNEFKEERTMEDMYIYGPTYDSNN